MTWECGASGRSCIGRIVSVVVVFLAFTGVGTLNAHDTEEICFEVAVDSNDNKLWTFSDFDNLPDGVRITSHCVPGIHYSHSHSHSHSTTGEESGSGSSASGRKVAETRQLRQTCDELPSDIRVTLPRVGAQCQRVTGAAIGNEAIVKAGPLDAVDVWGSVFPDTQVCFAASGGTFKFIDTKAMPRVVYDLPAYSDESMLCATINRAGIVVLLPGEAPPVVALPTASRSLSGCMVRTRYALNFRDAPGGEISSVLPAFVTLTAFERTDSWFKVDYHGARGWISADYVTQKGNCD